jgi:hypothetical protein
MVKRNTCMEKFERKRLRDRRRHNYGPDWDLKTGQVMPERRQPNSDRRKPQEIPEIIRQIYLI